MHGGRRAKQKCNFSAAGVTHVLWQVGVDSSLTVADGSVEFSFLSGGQQLIESYDTRKSDRE